MHFKVRQSDRVSDSRFYRLEIIRIADFCGAVNCNKITQTETNTFAVILTLTCLLLLGA